MKKNRLIAAIAAGTFGLIGAASAAHIDFIDQVGFNLTSDDLFDTEVLMQMDVGGTPGDTWNREVRVQAIAGGPVNFTLDPLAIDDGNALTTNDSFVRGATYSAGAGSIGVVGLLYNDFVADFVNVAPGVEWTRIDLTIVDPNSAELRATLTDADGTTSMLGATAVGTGNQTISFGYGLFDTAAMGGTIAGLDLENITAFRLEMAVPTFQTGPGAPVTGQDVSIALTDLRRAGAVPLPASLLLLITGIGGLVMRRKLSS